MEMVFIVKIGVMKEMVFTVKIGVMIRWYS